MMMTNNNPESLKKWMHYLMNHVCPEELEALLKQNKELNQAAMAGEADDTLVA